MGTSSKLDKSLIWIIACALVSIGIWLGRQEYQGSEDHQKIAELEKQARETAVVVGQFKILYFYGRHVKK
jgi:hypothetical protein